MTSAIYMSITSELVSAAQALHRAPDTYTPASVSFLEGSQVSYIKHLPQ